MTNLHTDAENVAKSIRVLFTQDAIEAINAIRDKHPNTLSYIVNKCVLHAAHTGYVPASRETE